MQGKKTYDKLRILLYASIDMISKSTIVYKYYSKVYNKTNLQKYYRSSKKYIIKLLVVYTFI